MALIEDPLTAGIDLVKEIGGSLIKHFFPDPAQQAAAEEKMAELETSGALAAIAGQLAINQEEAKSTNWFIAGWRPAVGWTCAFGLLYATILEPAARFVAVTMFHYAGQFPDLGTGVLVATLSGMLGIGAMRTVEKVTNSEGNR